MGNPCQSTDTPKGTVAHGQPEQRKISKKQGVADRNHYTHSLNLLCCSLPNQRDWDALSITRSENKWLKLRSREDRCWVGI